MHLYNKELLKYFNIIVFCVFNAIFLWSPSNLANSQLPDFSNIIRSVSDCVVSVVAMSSGQQDQSSQSNVSFSRGAGIVLSENGHIVTNNHIVENADRYFVELNNGFVYEGILIGGDYVTDIAVIKVDITNSVACEFINENENLGVGELVLGIGSPYSLSGSVSVGIISNLERPLAVTGEFTDYVLYIQTDLIINPGNSGGPVVNQNGKIIGMNSSTLLSNTGAAGIAFAIPVEVLLRVSRQLITNGLSLKGDIGIQVGPLPQSREQIRGLGLVERRGAVISDVQINSPAYHAGIRAGDIVVTVNRMVVENEHKFRYLIGALEHGSNARLSLIRNGSYFATEVQVEGRVIENPN